MLTQFNLDTYLKELELLVNTDSGTYDVEGVQKNLEMYEKMFSELGWKTRRVNHGTDKVGESLEIFNKEADLYDVFLLGHMDTVFAKDESKERPFKVEGNLAYGPGVADMKSCVLSIYYALKNMDFSKYDREPAILIGLNSHEEIGSGWSAEWIKESARKSKFALVVEAARPNGELVKARKGLVRCNFEFHGISAHSGNNPEAGASSIQEMARWINELCAVQNLAEGTSVNFGIVEGGTGANIVADYAKAVFESRYTQVAEYEKVMAKINELSKSPSVEGVKVDVSILSEKLPFEELPKATEVLAECEKIAAELGIEKLGALLAGGGSDANITAPEGIPTIDGFGPIGGKMHTADEYLEVDSIEPRLKLLIRTIDLLVK